jgi:hypothetical protein
VKSASTPNLIADCREALIRFWGETLKVEPDRAAGAVLALPLMFPDGLQVVVCVQPLTDRSLLISDQGETLGNLVSSGLNIESDVVGEFLRDRLQTFEFERAGLELRKVIRFPVQGVDIQLFGEALVSVAHLFYRLEPEAAVEDVVDRAVQRIFRDRSLQPKRNFFLEGALEKRIRVDYYLSGKRSMALEVVKRRKDILPYMEQWGWRWTDLRQRHATLLRAMVYDPDQQDWDESSLAIGRSVCEVFCPYFDQAAIAAGLAEVVG